MVWVDTSAFVVISHCFSHSRNDVHEHGLDRITWTELDPNCCEEGGLLQSPPAWPTTGCLHGPDSGLGNFWTGCCMEFNGSRTKIPDCLKTDWLFFKRWQSTCWGLQVFMLPGWDGSFALVPGVANWSGCWKALSASLRIRWLGGTTGGQGLWTCPMPPADKCSRLCWLGGVGGSDFTAWG